jgi:hypothetical protein
MNDTARKPIMTDTQHSLQWSAFKPRAIASKPLSLTNFDNPLPFATINEDNDKRKWGNPEDIDDGDRKKQRKIISDKRFLSVYKPLFRQVT